MTAVEKFGSEFNNVREKHGVTMVNIINTAKLLAGTKWLAKNLDKEWLYEVELGRTVTSSQQRKLLWASMKNALILLDHRYQTLESMLFTLKSEYGMGVGPVSIEVGTEVVRINIFCNLIDKEVIKRRWKIQVVPVSLQTI